jgi:moderate conductance mechanosensitive channel
MNWKSILRLVSFLLLFGTLLLIISLFFDVKKIFDLNHDKLVRFIMTVFSTYVIVLFSQRSLHLFFEKTDFIDRKREETLESIFVTGSNLIAIIIVIVAAISPFVDLGKVLAGAGIFSAVIGFGAQSLIKDFIYGIILVYERQFQKGDLVTVNHTIVGFVEEPGFRALKLRLTDGTLFTISNGEIRSIANGNAEKRRIDIEITISFREKPLLIRQILEAACKELNQHFADILFKKVNGEPEETFQTFGVTDFYGNGHGFVYRIVATVLDTEYFETTIYTKNFLADKLHENNVKMAEHTICYKESQC